MWGIVGRKGEGTSDILMLRCDKSLCEDYKQAAQRGMWHSWMIRNTQVIWFEIIILPLHQNVNFLEWEVVLLDVEDDWIINYTFVIDTFSENVQYFNLQYDVPYLLTVALKWWKTTTSEYKFYDKSKNSVIAATHPS